MIDTCSGNDTAERGDDHRWTWSNPTNRAIVHRYAGVEAVSVECMWQGTKIRAVGGRPDPRILAGQWRANKAARPLGAWAGEEQPLIVTPGGASRAIYMPAFAALIAPWMRDPVIADRVSRAKSYQGPIFLRDWDTGRGVDRDGPMSHAWVLASWLNSGEWPGATEAPSQGALFRMGA